MTFSLSFLLSLPSKNFLMSLAESERKSSFFFFTLQDSVCVGFILKVRFLVTVLISRLKRF